MLKIYHHAAVASYEMSISLRFFILILSRKWFELNGWLFFFLSFAMEPNPKLDAWVWRMESSERTLNEEKKSRESKRWNWLEHFAKQLGWSDWNGNFPQKDWIKMWRTIHQESSLLNTNSPIPNTPESIAHALTYTLTHTHPFTGNRIIRIL